MKRVTISFDIPSSYHDEDILRTLSISLILRQLGANTVSIQHTMLNNRARVYDLNDYRQNFTFRDIDSNSDKNE